MRKSNLLAMAMVGMTLSFGSCSENDETDVELPSETVITEAEMNTMIANYVDKVVIPTYRDLVANITTLKTTVDAFVASGAQEDLNKVCEAWRNARQPWELSEAFLYGPADLKNLDPSLDTWPLDKDGINRILKNQDFGNIEGDNADQQELRGFHTAEYLIFFNGQPRVLGEKQDEVDLKTENAKKYLTLVTNNLVKDATALYTAWKDGLGSDDSEVATSYGEAMKKHDGTYSLSSAEVVTGTILSEEGGMGAIANEVGEAKIGDPVTKYATESHEAGLLAVESWYSWNSLADYENNIISIENCYMGGQRGDRDNAASMSALVQKVNPALDTKVKEKIAAAIAALQNIPAPFRNHLDVTQYPQITVAQNACSDLVGVLKEVRTALNAN